MGAGLRWGGKWGKSLGGKGLERLGVFRGLFGAVTPYGTWTYKLDLGVKSR